MHGFRLSMGIYDRDYARERQAGGNRRPGMGAPMAPLGARWRFLSFNTWLIIVNVAVYVVMSFIPPSMNIALSCGTEVAQGISLRDHDAIILTGETVSRPGGFIAHPIIDRQTQKLLGYKRFQWMNPIEAVGHFSTGKGFLELEVWRLVSFQFLHSRQDISHLLFNMIGLYFFGPLVESRIGSRRMYGAYYLVCGIFGAIAYLVLNLLGFTVGKHIAIPGLLITDVYTPLIGASAGVFGVLMAAAYFAGDEIAYFFGLIPLKIRTAAYVYLAVEVFNLFYAGSNAGGSAAHIGGAIAGFFFVRRLGLLRDFFDILGPRRSASPGAGRTPKMRRRNSHSRVDEVLDKVKEHGIHSLSPEEQDVLRKATDQKRDGD